MFESLVVALREGVEATLILGIVLSYLRKTGRERWSRLVYWALGAALAASVLFAIAVHHWEVSEDAYEGWLLLVGSFFVASMVLWMWRSGKRLRQEIESRLTDLSAKPTRAAALGLFSFVFLMVGREGVETVLLLAAVSLRTTELLNFMGTLIGLALAVGLGVAFFKGSLKVNLRKFFSVTTLVLLVVAVQLGITGLHELSEAGVLPANREEMRLIGPVVNNEAFFFIVIIALVIFMMIAQRIREAGSTPADLSGLPAPERRKMLAEQQKERFWKITATAVGALVLVLISTEVIYSRSVQAMTPAEPAELAEGQVRLPVAKLADHKLHRFVIDVGGVPVRLIAILDSSDSVRAGLDACQICGTQGYYQDGPNVICRNCGAAVYVPTIGNAGGCNPIHVEYVVENNTLVLSQQTLRDAARIFK